MKYSLRSLFLVVTLVCTVLGGVMGRVEYLRRWSAFHFAQAKKYALKEHKTVSGAIPDATDALQHAELGRRFRDATWRPWIAIDTTPIRVHPHDAIMLAEDMINNNAASFIDH